VRWLPLALLASIHCGKGATSAPTASTTSTTTASGSDAAHAAEAGGDDDAGEPMDARESEAWGRAQDGGDDDDIRLADLVGCVGLRERAQDSRLRRTAVRAMAQCQDFSELPWLADLATRGSDADALEALDAIVTQSARVRRATDPEDADELHEGCGELLALAKTATQPAPRRVRAIRALRMLSERGCVKRADIPGDLDAK
jgi:hypothetical protein